VPLKYILSIKELTFSRLEKYNYLENVSENESASENESENASESFPNRENSLLSIEGLTRLGDTLSL
jgi:hypothetical protein